jgi:hypothetical protein
VYGLLVSKHSELETFLGPARLSTYLSAAGGDADRATDLYLWATEVSGALHAQLSFVELAVRNSIDRRLVEWNDAQGHGPEWTGDGRAAPLLYQLLRKPLRDARTWADKEAALRHPRHPRHGVGVTHDDVVAQLMFGAWVKLIRPISKTESSAPQKQLWTEVLRRAFPDSDQSDAGRRAIGTQLETMRQLRNRVAHHDNLLEVDIRHRQNGALSLLSKVDPALPALAVARSPLRRLVREDPRRSWSDR